MAFLYLVCATKKRLLDEDKLRKCISRMTGFQQVREGQGASMMFGGMPTPPGYPAGFSVDYAGDDGSAFTIAYAPMPDEFMEFAGSGMPGVKYLPSGVNIFIDCDTQEAAQKSAAALSHFLEEADLYAGTQMEAKPKKLSAKEIVERWRAAAAEAQDVKSVSDSNGSVESSRTQGVLQEPTDVVCSVPLADIDALDDGTWAAVARESPTGQVTDVMFSDGSTVDTGMHLWAPAVRWLHNGNVVVVNSRRDGGPNGVILNRTDGVLHRFVAGDGIEDIVPVGNRFVVTYFDEGVYSGDDLSQNGLVVFDADGTPSIKYLDVPGHVVIDDCYAATAVDDEHVLFCAYSDFNLVLLNIESGTQQMWPSPENTYGAKALSMREGLVYYHGDYDSPDIRSAAPGDKKATSVGRFPGQLRGLREGTFFARGEYGFTRVALEG